MPDPDELFERLDAAVLEPLPAPRIKLPRTVFAVWAALSLACAFALVALAARAFSDADQLADQRRESACRSGLAAAVDVAAGNTTVAIGRLVDQIATGDDQTVLVAVERLRSASDTLELALDDRARTAELCT